MIAMERRRGPTGWRAEKRACPDRTGLDRCAPGPPAFRVETHEPFIPEEPAHGGRHPPDREAIQ